MPRYRITQRFTADCTVEVEADSQEEAVESARDEITNMAFHSQCHDDTKLDIREFDEDFSFAERMSSDEEDDRGRCTKCGEATSFERKTEDMPPEGDICSGCCEWFCPDCIDYTYMAEINTENPICVDCAAEAGGKKDRMPCEACGMPIPNPPEDSTGDERLCDKCYEKTEADKDA